MPRMNNKDIIRAIHGSRLEVKSGNRYVNASRMLEYTPQRYTNARHSPGESEASGHVRKLGECT